MSTHRRVLHDDATAWNLGLLRAWVFGAWFLDIAKDPITDIAAIPTHTMTPVGVLRWVPTWVWEHVNTVEGLQIAYVVMLTLLAATAVGARPFRPIAIVTCVLLTFYQGFILSFTYLSHSTLAALPVAYVVALFPSGAGFSLWRGPPRTTSRETAILGMVAATLVFCATYAGVAARRLQTGGFEIFLDGTILKYVARNSMAPGLFEHHYGEAVIANPWLSTIMLLGYPIVTIFELLSPFCLFSRWFRWAWLAVIVPFHLLTWYLMQLLFVHNILLIAILILRVDRWLPSRWFGRP